MIKSLSHNIEDYPDGIVLPIDKPYRWTSADVIRKIKWAACRHFEKKNLKVGHAGTLDPLATGLLLVCIGAATRQAESLQASPKQYLAGVTFGATTPSFDLEKEIDARYPLDGVSEASLRALLPRLLGGQQQVAPLFSAKSVDGVRAYETARKRLRQAQAEGRPFDDGGLLQANHITLYGLELESFGPFVPPEIPAGDERSRIHVATVDETERLLTARIRVDCSKGTYIRALARDLGEALGSGAFLSSLRRTRNGPFDITQALALPDALALFTQP